MRLSPTARSDLLRSRSQEKFIYPTESQALLLHQLSNMTINTQPHLSFVEETQVKRKDVVGSHRSKLLRDGRRDPGNSWNSFFCVITNRQERKGKETISLIHTPDICTSRFSSIPLHSSVSLTSKDFSLTFHLELLHHFARPPLPLSKV